MGFGERFREVRKSIVASQQEFANLLNVAQKTVSNWESGRNDPPMDLLQMISKRHNIDMNWLFTGEGGMYRVKPERDTPAGRADYSYLSGYASSSGVLSINTKWLKSVFNAEPENLFTCYVNGDSMEPTLKSGDIVLGDRSQSSIGFGGIFVVKSGEELYVKRVQKTGENTLLLSNDNTVYPPVTIKTDNDTDFAICGKVVWVGKKL